MNRISDADFLRNYDGPPLRIMEVCGTHTAAIFKSGIRDFLSPKIRLVSGPGCPVCVTVPSFIDECIDISFLPGYELICFGDLLKVPGSKRTLSDAKGAGGRVRMAWSPFDAIALAQHDPETIFVVVAIGFETTAPAFALLVEEAEALGIRNLKLITSLKSALSAIDWICAMGEDVDAFLCPGHVSVVTGADAYLSLAEKYGKPFVIAGFEAEHLLAAVRAAVEDAAKGRGVVRNLYPEAVSAEGNLRARAIVGKYFDLCDESWRGLGTIANSGFRLKKAYCHYELGSRESDKPEKRLLRGAQRSLSETSEKFGGSKNRRDARPKRARSILDPNFTSEATKAPRDRAQATKVDSIQTSRDTLVEGCRCGDVILGRIDPDECPLFGAECTPTSAVGPCMVSSEGACGTWYKSRG
jgi:hydrogenase expression/formation protein HypD